MDKTTKNTVMISLLSYRLRALTELVADRLGAEDPKLFAAELRLKAADAGNAEFLDLNERDPEAAAIFLEVLNAERAEQSGRDS